MPLKKIVVYLIMLGITLIMYFPSIQTGFVGDWFGWQSKFDTGNYLGIFNTFGWHGNQQVTVFFLYTLYKIFGLNGWGWYLFDSGLHALNAFLLFTFFMRFFRKYEIKSGFFVALSGSLLFLLSPYNAEPVVLKVCVHYLVCDFLLLCALHFAIDYVETGKIKFIFLLALAHFLAAFTIEYALILPLAVITIVLFWQLPHWDGKTFIRNCWWLCLPQIIIIVFFFVMNKILLNEWIGHYGAEIHFTFTIPELFSNYYKYLLKYLFFARYLPDTQRSQVFNFTDQTSGLVIITLAILIIVAFFLIFYKRIGSKLRLAFMSFFLFFVFLAPIITLWADLMMYENNDRYGYPASMFFWMGMVLVFACFPGVLRAVLVAGAMVVSIFLLSQTVDYWNVNGKVFTGLVDDFRWYDKDQVIILGIADDYLGTPLFRIYNQPTGFDETLKYYRNKPYQGNMMDVAQFNMVHPDDGMNVSVDSTGQVIVHFNQVGNWWWWNGLGAVNRETDQFSLKVNDNALHIRFKNLSPNHVIIYQVGNHWEELKGL